MRGVSRETPLAVTHVFVSGEWALLRTVADALEWSYRWTAPAAQGLRFVLDFAYATGLRASELVGATLGSIAFDAHGAGCTWSARPAKSSCPRSRGQHSIATSCSGACLGRQAAGSPRRTSSAGWPPRYSHRHHRGAVVAGDAGSSYRRPR